MALVVELLRGVAVCKGVRVVKKKIKAKFNLDAPIKKGRVG